MGSKKAWSIALTLLGLVLLGTVVVLSTVQVYFGVDSRDIIALEEAAYFASRPSLAYGSNATTAIGSTQAIEKIPRIIHQTWKNESLPERWDAVRAQCLAMHPDFEYKLWTDDGAREFIAQQYPWFLDSFDNYPYPIQRADAIRYFVLHHYGGVYMDLDIGCRKPLHPLLNFEIILPRTKPVGVSNDLMFAAPRHAFMDLVIHNLLTFNHVYGTNYPTVMFSTGPMFLSAQYGLWPKVDGTLDKQGVPQRQTSVRILPKALYGKNAKPEESEDSFFWHYYGSSWHAEDAGFVTFLGNFGMFILYSGSLLLTVGLLRLVWSKRKIGSSAPQVGPISLPFNLPHALSDGGRSAASTPTGSRPGSPLPPPFGTSLRSASPSAIAGSSDSQKAGYFAWVPVFYPQGDNDRLVPPTTQARSSYVPSLAYYPSADGAPAYFEGDSDAASIHSMHTIRKPRRKQRSRDDKMHSRTGSGAACPAEYASTDEDDVESQLLGRYRKPKFGKDLVSSNRPSSWLAWSKSLLGIQTGSPPSPPCPSDLKSANANTQPIFTLTAPHASPPPIEKPLYSAATTASQQQMPFRMPPPGYQDQARDADETVGGNPKIDFDSIVSSGITSIVTNTESGSAGGKNRQQSVDRLLSEMAPKPSCQKHH